MDRLFIVTFEGEPFVVIKAEICYGKEILSDWYAETYHFDRSKLDLLITRPLNMVSMHTEVA